MKPTTTPRPSAFALAAVTLLASAPLTAPLADPAPAAIPLELNKLEPLTQGGPGCRVYFVVTNPETDVIEQLRLDLILFGTDGVIARRVALELGPLPAKKTGVRLFDLSGVPCDGIGRVLVNDILAYHAGGKDAAAEQDRAAALDRLTLTSRSSVPIGK